VPPPPLAPQAVTRLLRVPPAITNSTEAQFVFFTPNATNHVCSIDSLATANCSTLSTAHYQNLLDGLHTFTVEAVFDPFAEAVADLYEYTPASYQWTIGTHFLPWTA
jgi:hypothetical protein